MPFPIPATPIYGGWTQEGEQYADLKTRFSSYNVKSGGLAVDSITDDRAALNTLVNVTMQPNGGQLDIVGVMRIGTSVTIPTNVVPNFIGGARIVPDAAAIVTINGPLSPGRKQIFAGLGQISFRSGSNTGFASKVDAAFPEWWGGFPGDGLVNITDAGPGFQSAVRSGSRRISCTEGAYVFLTQVLVNEDPTAPNDLLIEGTTRTGTYLLAGPAAGTFGAINAMFVNKQNNGKLSFRRLRWSGSGFATPAFLGYGVYALENGASSQAIFSGEIDDCWIGLGNSAQGFFYGAMNNYLVRNCTFEAMKDRFTLIGTGNADIRFVNNSEYGCYGPFVDASQDTNIKNIITISGLHSYSAQDRVLLKMNNVDALILSDITYQMNDPVLGGTLGLWDFTNVRRLMAKNISAQRYPGSTNNMFEVVKMNGCSGRIVNMHINGGRWQLQIQGNVDLDFYNSTFLNAQDFNLRFPALTFGRVRFANCRLQYCLNGNVNYQVDNSTNDLIFENTDILDPLYGVGAAASYGNYISTGGRVRFIGGRLGRSTNFALGTAWAALTAYAEGDIRSDGGNNYICWNAHTSSAAGAGGNEPGVGATYTTFWQKHVSVVNAYLFLAGTGTVKIDGTENLDPTVLLRHSSSTMTLSLIRWINAQRTVAPYSASVPIDPGVGTEFDVTATNGVAFTVTNPSNAFDGCRITITIRNTSGGALGAVTWDTLYKLAAWTSPATAFSRSIDFKYNGTNWIEVARTAADVPN